MIKIIIKSVTFSSTESHAHLLDKAFRLLFLLNEREQIFHNAIKHLGANSRVNRQLANGIRQNIIPGEYQQ